MKLEVLTDDKAGSVWDLSELVTDTTWKTTRIGKAGSLSLIYVKDKNIKLNNGDILRVKKDGQNVFYGYVFSIEDSQDDTIQLTAYDQIRYLMSNDTYVFKNITATEVLTKIASDFGLKTGTLAATKYKIPSMAEDNQKLLDIICKALDYTLINTGKIYVFYDDFGQLALRNIEDMVLDFVIGDGSLVAEYKRKRSIDDETANRIKLVKDNKDTGKREVYIAQDSANIAKWGRLQLYQTVDEKYNAAQINELLNSLLELKNRESKTLQITAIGDIRVRAGCYVPLIISDLGINQKFLVDECTHKISGDDHTMTLDLKMI